VQKFFTYLLVFAQLLIHAFGCVQLENEKNVRTTTSEKYFSKMSLFGLFFLVAYRHINFSSYWIPYASLNNVHLLFIYLKTKEGSITFSHISLSSL